MRARAAGACVVAVVLSAPLLAAQRAAAVPHPPLEALEPAVAEQLRQARRDLDASPNAAGAYGALARLYHVYEFFEEAEAAYLQAIRRAPGDVQWPHLLGYLYQQTGRLDDAAARFLDARRISTADHAAALRLGEVYLALNRTRDARDAFDSVRAQFPALARHGLGEVALRDGRFDEAIAHFEAVLERVPQATSIHYSLAMAYRGAGRLDEARTHLARRGPAGLRIGDPIVDALEALVTGERGLVVRGRRAFESGQLDAAADAFGKALRIEPASIPARANLGLVLAAQGRDAEALEHLRAAFAGNDADGGTGRGLAGVLLRLQRHDEAIGVLSKVHAAHPDDEDALVGLSILLSNRERYREAVSLLERATRTRPEQRAATTTLARLLASSPDLAVRDGRRAFALAMAVYEQDPVPVHAETVAMSLAELARCDEAAEWIGRAITAAKRAGDAAEMSRLESELARYRTTPCRRL